MTSTELMTLLDQHKNDIPDGLYLGMANLLKQKHSNGDVDEDYKLVKIVYVRLKIMFHKKGERYDYDYHIQNQVKNKEVFVKKDHNLLPDNVFEFKNVHGKDTIERNFEWNTKCLFSQTYDEGADDDVFSVDVCFDKYTLVSIVDV